MKDRAKSSVDVPTPDGAADGASARALAARARADQPWFLYLILCRNGAIYTGIALDVAKRYAAHVAGTGARYTRSNPPVQLLAVLAFPNQQEASRAEWATKQMTVAEKRALIKCESTGSKS